MATHKINNLGGAKSDDQKGQTKLTKPQVCRAAEPLLNYETYGHRFPDRSGHPGVEDDT